MEFEIDGEKWVMIKQAGQWAVFAVTGPSWLGSRYNVAHFDWSTKKLNNHGSRYLKLSHALASLKEHAHPPKRMHSYLSNGSVTFKP